MAFIKDILPVNLRTGHWIEARNILLNKKNYSKSNEYGFEVDVQAPYKIIGVIATFNEKVIFSTDNTNCEIGLFRNGVYTTILNSPYLGFSDEHPITGVYRYSFNQQLIVVFTDNNQEPYLINLDCLPISTFANSNFAIEDLDLLRLFPKYNIPNFVLNSVDEDGSLETGAYYFTTAYEFNDGTLTQYSPISSPVYINDESYNVSFADFDGAEPGTLSNKSINIKFDNLDRRYKFLNVFVIKKIGGVLSAEKIKREAINSSSISLIYTGEEITTDVVIDDILIPNISYKRVKSFAVIEDRLYAANLQLQQDVDLQEIANNITIKWIKKDRLSLDSIKNSHKDPVILFDKKAFQHNEVYCFYLVGTYLDGTKSEAFHIPGRLPISDEKDVIVPSNKDEYLLGENIKNYQIRDTCGADTFDFEQGIMSYWENENEVYPDSFPNFAGQNVRHHKFPSIAFFEKVGKPFIYDNDASINLGDYLGTLDKNVCAVNSVTIYSIYHVLNFLTAGTNIAGKHAKFDSNLTNSTLGLYYEYAQNTDYNSYEATVPQITKVEIDLKIRLNNSAFPNYTIAQLDVLKVDAYGNIQLLDTITEICDANRDVRFLNDYYYYLQPEEQITIFTTSTFPYFWWGGFVKFHAYKSADGFYGNKSTDLLGIRLENINIPQSIKNQFQYFEICYAKRDVENTSMLGQSIARRHMEPEDLNPTSVNLEPTFVRMYPFDMLRVKANSNVSYLRYEYNKENPTIVNLAGKSIGDIIAVKNSGYLPINNTLTEPITNTSQEECLFVQIYHDYLNGDFSTSTSILKIDTDQLYSLCIFKRNFYNKFFEQEIVSTGYRFTGDNSIEDRIYGGDTHICLQGTRILRNDAFSLPEIITFYCEAISNIGLRHEGSDYFQKYYPKTRNKYTISKTTGGYSSGDIYKITSYTGTTTDGYEESKTVSDYIGYNTDYSSLNELNKIFGKQYLPNCVSNQYIFPTRIARSQLSQKEEYSISWRTFPVNDYFEMEKDKGSIWYIMSDGNTLYIQHEHALYIAFVKDKMITDVTEIYLGKGDIFDRDPDRIMKNIEGYVGSVSQYATTISLVGYVTVDLMQGKIFLFDGTIKEISNNGLRNFFQETLPKFKNIDNPFLGYGATCAYDIENNRILFGFRSEENQFTISYDVTEDSWICYHDYYPDYMFSSRQGLFSVKDDKIYKHNVKTVFGKYYDVDPYPSYYDLVFSSPDKSTNYAISIQWESLVEDLNKNYIQEETISHIMIYNDHQCSGLIPLSKFKQNLVGGNLSLREKQWSFNKFNDLVINHDLDFIDENGNIITTNINQDKAWYNKNKIYGKFVIVRFFYDNSTQKNIYIHNENVSIRKSSR